MSGRKGCFMCGSKEGDAHPVTGRQVEDLIVNGQGAAFICFDCVDRCMAIMAGEISSDSVVARSSETADDRNEFAIRGIHEPVIHAEEHILPTQRAALHRLAERGRDRVIINLVGLDLAEEEKAALKEASVTALRTILINKRNPVADRVTTYGPGVIGITPL